jgi:hypothetical protein
VSAAVTLRHDEASEHFFLTPFLSDCPLPAVPCCTAHTGHARVYVAFDVLYRLLRVLGYDVQYVRNFTDIDDKIIARAAQSGEGPLALSARFIAEYHTDMKLLGCLPPSVSGVGYVGAAVAGVVLICMPVRCFLCCRCQVPGHCCLCERALLLHTTTSRSWWLQQQWCPGLCMYRTRQCHHPACSPRCPSDLGVDQEVDH